MARMSFDEAEKLSGKGLYLSLKNDRDSAVVQFLTNSLDEVPVYNVHSVKDENGRYRDVNCLRNLGDDVDVCPFCKEGYETKIVRFAIVYNLQLNAVQLFKRTKTFFRQLSTMMERYRPISRYMFEIIRNGEKGDLRTSYDILKVENDNAEGYCPVDVQDLTIPEIEGNAILNLSAEQMERYLSTGKLGNNEDSGYQERSSRRIPESDNLTPRRQPVGVGRDRY